MVAPVVAKVAANIAAKAVAPASRALRSARAGSARQAANTPAKTPPAGRVKRPPGQQTKTSNSLHTAQRPPGGGTPAAHRPPNQARIPAHTYSSNLIKDIGTEYLISKGAAALSQQASQQDSNTLAVASSVADMAFLARSMKQDMHAGATAGQSLFLHLPEVIQTLSNAGINANNIIDKHLQAKEQKGDSNATDTASPQPTDVETADSGPLPSKASGATDADLQSPNDAKAMNTDSAKTHELQKGHTVSAQELRQIKALMTEKGEKAVKEIEEKLSGNPEIDF